LWNVIIRFICASLDTATIIPYQESFIFVDFPKSGGYLHRDKLSVDCFLKTELLYLLVQATLFNVAELPAAFLLFGFHRQSVPESSSLKEI
jgi:hypothetical protein